MLRITAAAKALLLAFFALLSLTAATGEAAAAHGATGPAAAAAEPGTEPPVAARGSCSPPDSDTAAHPGQVRRAQRPQTGPPQTAVHATCALPPPAAELPRRSLTNDDDAPYCHAPSRSGDLPVALQVFRC
ncbi:hypothetical protein AR457_30175 [Streptomyces agglomeratus]|uniref:hypothetical protein n=1 Tax=Streptomyces agglomeratus TaxID=285458 RepID=UPI0008540178|nr:hypothetical protein [Streptomyces agglomeratus]OEJ37831.1 hypothetical protein BGK70_06470 [Streptomyces agglomeratus]OEJ47784.1 hypothetical protein AR457_30175 [Streptomyces agglomeratus]OEJ50367.1 hypothetical protein BGK72_05990 [Streptomyces agglomeratus]OEJ57694.1 hypothetical protein BGM19_06675 [Streptomyces agglomeratus]